MTRIHPGYPVPVPPRSEVSVWPFVDFRKQDFEVPVHPNPVHFAYTYLDEGYRFCPCGPQGLSKSRLMAFLEGPVPSVLLVLLRSLEALGQDQSLWNRKLRTYDVWKKSSSSSAVGRSSGSWFQHLCMSSHNPSLRRVSGRRGRFPNIISNKADW